MSLFLNPEQMEKTTKEFARLAELLEQHYLISIVREFNLTTEDFDLFGKYLLGDLSKVINHHCYSSEEWTLLLSVSEFSIPIINIKGRKERKKAVDMAFEKLQNILKEKNIKYTPKPASSLNRIYGHSLKISLDDMILELQKIK